MANMKFSTKTITDYSKEDVRFECKNIHKHAKLANFCLDIISKINC